MSLARAPGAVQPSTYEVDFHRWTADQAAALRNAASAEIDWENVAEEIESLGRSYRRALENRFEILLAHLLKCLVQPERRTRSWDMTIAEQRKQIASLIERNPSLGDLPRTNFDRAYKDAVWRATRDSGLPESAFPPASPFTVQEVLDPAFLPDKMRSP